MFMTVSVLEAHDDGSREIGCSWKPLTAEEKAKTTDVTSHI